MVPQADVVDPAIEAERGSGVTAASDVEILILMGKPVREGAIVRAEGLRIARAGQVAVDKELLGVGAGVISDGEVAPLIDSYRTDIHSIPSSAGTRSSPVPEGPLTVVGVVDDEPVAECSARSDIIPVGDRRTEAPAARGIGIGPERQRETLRVESRRPRDIEVAGAGEVRGLAGRRIGTLLPKVDLAYHDSVVAVAGGITAVVIERPPRNHGRLGRNECAREHTQGEKEARDNFFHGNGALESAGA